MLVPPTGYRHLGRTLERSLVTLVRAGQVGLFLSVLGLCVLFANRMVAGRFDVTHPIAWMSGSTPALTMLVVGGLSLCLLNGALVLFLLYSGIDDLRSGLAAIFGCIGFGFGAGVLDLAIPLVVTRILGV